MSERKVGLVQDVLVAPWYGDVFDLVLTDARFLLVHVSTFKMRTRIGTRSVDQYQRDSPEALAASPNSISVPFRSVQRIRARPGLQRGLNYLVLKYSDGSGRRRKLKVLYMDSDSTRMYLVERVDINKEKYTPMTLGFDEGMSILLAKAIPESVIEKK